VFKNDLKRRLELIFGMKATFNIQSEENEQDKIFINIDVCRPRISSKDGGRETAKVIGSIIVTSQDDRFTYGFITKRIEKADPELTRPFFFYDVDAVIQNEGIMNVHERSTSFVFLYESQYDPSKGELTSLDTNISFEV